jgi:hypothetical protein
MFCIPSSPYIPSSSPLSPGQDVRKAQSLGFALDEGISLVVVDVTKPVE